MTLRWNAASVTFDRSKKGQDVKIPYQSRIVFAAFAGLMLAGQARAADVPTPQEGDWTAPNFAFHTGSVMPQLHLHYTTIGSPAGEPVVILHGTAGSGAGMVIPGFADLLFGEGQPLDARKYFIIFPDALGAGKSAKPSDGLKTEFPRYDYADMVEAQYRLLHEGLGLQHVRLVMGNSMGGMNTWVWGERHPDFMDALVPMASQPTAMSGRNWMLRRLLIDMIRQDPAWQGGNYQTQPPSLRIANVFFGIATSGGTLAYQSLVPTSQAGDQWVAARLAAPMPSDANDFIYQWESSNDYDPSEELDRIHVPVLAINSADDERNPPETGLMTQALARIKDAHLLLIPASKDTRGHGTTMLAKFYTKDLQNFLQTLPQFAK
jgi:homoserine O-acetyltransferase